jgi:hypothetical protein
LATDSGRRSRLDPDAAIRAIEPTPVWMVSPGRTAEDWGMLMPFKYADPVA